MRTHCASYPSLCLSACPVNRTHALLAVAVCVCLCVWGAAPFPTPLVGASVVVGRCLAHQSSTPPPVPPTAPPPPHRTPVPPPSAAPAPRAAEPDFRASLTTSLGKSGAVNTLSTVFAKERKEDVLARKLASDRPLDMAKRGTGLHAMVMPR